MMSNLRNLRNLRIASLVPSVTELVVALGLRAWLVARTGFCIHPADAVGGIPKIGGTKDVNLAKLQGLAPTHVIVNIDENRLETVEAMRQWPNAPRIIVTHPKRPEDNLTLVAQLVDEFADYPGVRNAGAALTSDLQRELELTRAAAWPAQKVLYLIWRDPWMTVARDTYVSELLARVNWQTWPASRGGDSGAARYPVVHGSEPWTADVQQILLSSEPYSFAETHFAAAQQLCPNARVRLIDGEMLSWYGSRAVAGLRYLRNIAGELPQ